MSQLLKDVCLLFTIDPTVINLGLHLNGNISVFAGHCRGVMPDHLSKVWCIDIEAAKKTLEITTQLGKHKVDDLRIRIFSNNNRMLQYKRINKHFFIDTFFVTKKTKSTLGNTCM